MLLLSLPLHLFSFQIGEFALVQAATPAADGKLLEAVSLAAKSSTP